MTRDVALSYDECSRELLEMFGIDWTEVAGFTLSFRAGDIVKLTLDRFVTKTEVDAARFVIETYDITLTKKEAHDG